jgi:hypothetical protein
MNTTIIRPAYLRDCVLGWWNVGGLKIATIEDAWRPDPDGAGGQRREGSVLESCIPDGTYELVPHDGTKWQGVWAFVNPRLGVYRWPDDIPPDQKYGRSAILAHSGKDQNNSLGCIIVGLRHGIENNRYRVFESEKALELLRGVLGRHRHTVTIRPTAGTDEKAA